MVRFLSLLASGLSLGGVYALVSLGFVLVFKSTRVFNLAMGEFLMVGTYLGFFFISHLGWPFIPAIVVVAILMGILGLFVHYRIMRGLVGRPFFAIVLVTIGVAIVIRGVILVVAGPIELARMTSLSTRSYYIGGAKVEAFNFIIFGAACCSLVASMCSFNVRAWVCTCVLLQKICKQLRQWVSALIASMPSPGESVWPWQVSPVSFLGTTQLRLT